jgi:L-glutamine-phosphate cytidylyltransferase
MSTTKAIILAAGKSSRLYPLTLERPKCLLELNGKPIIQWQIEILRKIGISDIVVVVGYKKETIINELGKNVRFRHYDDFDKTNNLHTLYSVRDELNQDCLCLFSDVLTDLPILESLAFGRGDFTLLVNTRQVRDDTIRIIKEGDLIKRIGSHLTVEESDGNYLGICKISKKGCELLNAQMTKLIKNHRDDYFTIAIDKLSIVGNDIYSKELEDSTWLEVDTSNDYDKAKKNFHLIKNTLQ